MRHDRVPTALAGRDRANLAKHFGARRNFLWELHEPPSGSQGFSEGE